MNQTIEKPKLDCLLKIVQYPCGPGHPEFGPQAQITSEFRHSSQATLHESEKNPWTYQCSGHEILRFLLDYIGSWENYDHRGPLRTSLEPQQYPALENAIFYACIIVFFAGVYAIQVVLRPLNSIWINDFNWYIHFCRFHPCPIHFLHRNTIHWGDKMRHFGHLLRQSLCLSISWMMSDHNASGSMGHWW